MLLHSAPFSPLQRSVGVHVETVSAPGPTCAPVPPARSLRPADPSQVCQKQQQTFEYAQLWKSQYQTLTGENDEVNYDWCQKASSLVSPHVFCGFQPGLCPFNYFLLLKSGVNTRKYELPHQTPKTLENIPKMAYSHLCCNCAFTNSDRSPGVAVSVSYSCWMRVCSGR